ncbi:DNA-binding proteins Bright/BRCAA1/rbp1 [Trifolium repens]|nr:DNA-binding proteins Bright/BRCAA1/rbp1 [Trifolium repens]
MADGFWNRQHQTLLPHSGLHKRPRSDYGNEMHNYLAREEDRSGHPMVKDTKQIGSAYDRYLQSGQLSSFTSGEASTIGGLGLQRGVGGLPNHSLGDPAVMMGRHGGGGPDLAPNGRGINYGFQPPMDPVSRPGPETALLPPDASPTLYIEGLPSDCTRREVAHIFRPFVGYREVRLVSKEAKHRGDPLILCFVDFANPACAATALSALQGYKVDEINPESSHLRLQFSRYPGPRSGGGPRSSGPGPRGGPGSRGKR